MQRENFWRHLRTSVAAVMIGHDMSRQIVDVALRAAPKKRHAAGAANPRILVLTSGLGCGHVRAAQAVQQALLQRARDATLQVLDWWSLINAGVAYELQQMYLSLVQQHASLYERIYQLDEQTWREILSHREPMPPSVTQFFELIKMLHANPSDAPVAGGVYGSDRALLALLCNTDVEGRTLVATGLHAKLALLKWSWARLVHRLEQKLMEFAPDAIVSTQMIPAALVSSIKLRRGLNVPSVAVPTDFGVHDFWDQRGTDLYCLGHEAITELPHSLDERRVVATGFPLLSQFQQPIAADEARRWLGIKHDIPVILILGGGLGLGVEAVAEQLLRVPIPLQLLVLAGRNVRAGTKLAAVAVQYPARVKTFDWTERVAVFIRAADLVVGKPGGLSVAEVLACGRPLLATRSLRGQEGFNVRFLEQHQAGMLLSDAQLATHIEFLLTHPLALAGLQAHAWALGRRNGAEEIATQVLGLVTEARRPTELPA